jgi:hypothetical protein
VQVEPQRPERERHRGDHGDRAEDAVEVREGAATPRRAPSRGRSANVAAKNQKYAAPTQIHWKVVFHFAGPMAAITRPRARLLAEHRS